VVAVALQELLFAFALVSVFQQVVVVALAVLCLIKIILQLSLVIHTQLLSVLRALVDLVLQMGVIAPQHYLPAICLQMEAVEAWCEVLARV
jgi:hypothetical protein